MFSECRNFLSRSTEMSLNVPFPIEKQVAGGLRLAQYPIDFKGWQPNSQGIDGRHNPRGFGLLWVVVQKIIDGQRQDLYEQPVIVENPGSIVVCQAKNKIAFVQSFRMVGERLKGLETEYVRRLQSEQRWDELAATLGRWCWELPRGIAPIQGSTDINEVVIRTAKQELLEEAGLYIAKAKIVGRVNTNPTFFAHAQYVVHGELESAGQRNLEELEIIGDKRFFTPREIRQMVDAQQLDDGLSLSALSVCGIHF